jgi:hypothetical protein
MVRRNAERINAAHLDDDVLRRMYVEYNIPCDRLVSDPGNLQPFAEDYAHRTGQQIETAQVSHRLLTLRKLGGEKGGLARLRRTYNGRKNAPETRSSS